MENNDGNNNNNDNNGNEERAQRLGKAAKAWEIFQFVFMAWFLNRNISNINEYLFHQYPPLAYRRSVELWERLPSLSELQERSSTSTYFTPRLPFLYDTSNGTKSYVFHRYGQAVPPVLIELWELLPQYWYFYLITWFISAYSVLIFTRGVIFPLFRMITAPIRRPVNLAKRRVLRFLRRYHLLGFLVWFYNVFFYFCFVIAQEYIGLRSGLVGTLKQLYVLLASSIGFYLMTLQWRRPGATITSTLYGDVEYILRRVPGLSN
ncbi:hypothetical protein F5Y04DRAFT_284639 [Hypomontagnella monticulosa]|nr:hypothetical protein F5Y04DRAFT_284639 [Hypomontagnella monticulosa]